MLTHFNHQTKTSIMKISQRQAALLAKKVVAELKAKKSFKVSELIKAKIKNFVETRRELVKAKNDAAEAVNRHDATLQSIIGKVDKLYGYDNQQAIIEKLEKKNIPSEEEICDEIILKAMFTNEEDLDKFISSITKRFEKNLQLKVASN
jgi:hypothetical protein